MVKSLSFVFNKHGQHIACYPNLHLASLIEKCSCKEHWLKIKKIHLINKYFFIEYLLIIRYCSVCLGYNNERNETENPCLQGSYILLVQNKPTDEKDYKIYIVLCQVRVLAMEKIRQVKEIGSRGVAYYT